MNIRMLTQQDWKIWKEFRLEALKNSPENFVDSYEEALNHADSYFQNTIAKNDIFCVLDGNAIVSCVGFCVFDSEKTKHRGLIWGMYTNPEYRRKGLGNDLMQTVIMHAKSRVIQLHLECVTRNLSAIAFYQKQGFKIYGTKPHTLKIGDGFFDTHLMVLEI